MYASIWENENLSKFPRTCCFSKSPLSSHHLHWTSRLSDISELSYSNKQNPQREAALVRKFGFAEPSSTTFLETKLISHSLWILPLLKSLGRAWSTPSFSTASLLLNTGRKNKPGKNSKFSSRKLKENFIKWNISIRRNEKTHLCK